MICFLLVSLTYWKQLLLLVCIQLFRCDLLSFSIFDVLETTVTCTETYLLSCDLLSFSIFDVLETTRQSSEPLYRGL